VIHQTLALLNMGQAIIIAIGVLVSMILSGQRVVDGELSVCQHGGVTLLVHVAVIHSLYE